MVAENVLLYGSEEEFDVIITWLRKNGGKAAVIARAGQALVWERHSWKVRAKELSSLLAEDINPSPSCRVDRLRIMGAGS